MKRFALILCLLPLLCIALGCSSKLTRSEAKHQIDAMMKPHPVGPKKIMSPGGYVPGYELQQDDYSKESFEIGLAGTDLYLPLTNALAKLGYVTIKDEGPGNFLIGSSKYHSDSRYTVTLTGKVGRLLTKTGYDETYQTGIECFPEPNPTQCELPSIIDKGKDYQITGITQDEIHAKVNILIPWKLTQFALGLKPYVRSDEGKPDYYLNSWEKFLNSHPASGSSPATILFQKFDDGWRITDENGKTEKDFN